jgi:hypothetical protein
MIPVYAAAAILVVIFFGILIMFAKYYRKV